DVAAYEAIADALAPNGIPADLLSEALTPMNERLVGLAEMSEWADVTITPEMEIFADGRAYALLSESERWRVDAHIAAAISHFSGLKLLVLDRADVL
ncbi:DNA repair protein, partial [Burkholderia sola]|nr:DNA repair protein [Burkholderia sola]